MAIKSTLVHKLEIPIGREIGDNGCAYTHLHVVVVRLRDDSGLEGWGTWHGASRGRNLRPAEWFQELAAEAELRNDLEGKILPVLSGQEAAALLRAMPALTCRHDLLVSCVREALWDLAAKQVNQPLWRFMGGTRHRVSAYGSLLDFPVTEGEACDHARRLVKRGFRTIKVKLGGSLDRDVQRLKALRAALGPHVALTGDANEAWTVDSAVAALAAFRDEGVGLGYIEDPLPRTDLAGFVELARRSGTAIAAHDYFTNPAQLEPLIAGKGVNILRSRRAPDYAVEVDRLALHHGLTCSMTNSLFEVATHLALALPRFDRIEFSDIGWNAFAPHPIRYEAGYALAPTAPGLGQDIAPVHLERFHVPQASHWRAPVPTATHA